MESGERAMEDTSRTQISEPSSNKTEKRNSSNDQTALEESLDELEFIQTEDEVKNMLVTIVNLVINSGGAKAMVRHLWKAIEFMNNITTNFNGNRPIKLVQWNCRILRSKFPKFQQRSRNIDVKILSETWLDEAENV
jgi:hypothetical protein